mmetsp:Transcript_2317/g.8139  ORF Transcript_2317/g.8139 Transcript_2317/m.8139 type:complete len:261 (-) Transcript_2317:673-1455(-)
MRNAAAAAVWLLGQEEGHIECGPASSVARPAAGGEPARCGPGSAQGAAAGLANELGPFAHCGAHGPLTPAPLRVEALHHVHLEESRVREVPVAVHRVVVRRELQVLAELVLEAADLLLRRGVHVRRRHERRLVTPARHVAPFDGGEEAVLHDLVNAVGADPCVGVLVQQARDEVHSLGREELHLVVGLHVQRGAIHGLLQAQLPLGELAAPACGPDGRLVAHRGGVVERHGGGVRIHHARHLLLIGRVEWPRRGTLGAEG